MYVERRSAVLPNCRIKISDDGPVTKFEASYPAHVPHWERAGQSAPAKAWATFDALGHTDAGWVTIVTQEHGERSSRQTMLTLRRDEARAFAEWLLQVTGVQG